MRRLLVSTLFPLLAILALALPVRAELIWCKQDPVVRLDGTTVQIWVAVPAQYQVTVNGPVEVEVGTPRGVARELVSTDDGFNGHGEVVSFSDLKVGVKNRVFPTEIRVKVPVDRSQLATGEIVPVQVEVIPENADHVTVRGTSDITRVVLLVAGQ